MNYTWYPRVLVVGPGGIKGLKILGFLSPLEDSGLFQYTDTYCGVSVGAIICLLIVAGYQIREIVSEAATLDIFKDIRNFTIKSMMEHRGIISSEPIRQRLNQLIINKFGTIPNLHNLYLQTGKAFIAVTLNATDETCTMMSPFTHPTVSCVDATMFSMNIPFIFYQLVHQNKIYVDGALAHPYPVDYFDDANTPILGIYTRSKNPINTTHTSDISISFSDYSRIIINALIDQRTIQIVQNTSSSCKHCCLESNSSDILGYTLSMEEKARMLVEGFNQGKEFLTSIQSNTYSGPTIPDKVNYTYPEYYLLNQASPRESYD